MDFTGGSLIEVRLEKKLDTSEMQSVITVLQNRLNAFGLKDVAVRPWGSEYIVVEIAETDNAKINQLQSLLGQQGKFETLYKGKVVLSGTDIVNVIRDPQKGYSIIGTEWRVPFLLTADGATHFAAAVEGECTPAGNDQCAEQVYMFIDRPADAVILVNSSLYAEEASVPVDFDQSDQTIPLQDLVENSGCTLLVSDSIDNATIQAMTNRTVVVAEGSFNATELGKYAPEVLVRPKVKKYWIETGLNIENIVHLTPSVTSGSPVTEPSITGHAQTAEEARREMLRVEILLKSGKLPVSISIGSVSTISPSLGPMFLKYSIIAGVLAILMVGFVIFIRYRRIRIVLPVMSTCISEVVMILGIAALIGWQIDLPAIAGIVSAVGTGVDHQIIITDEVLRREQQELSMANRIKKAFAIIFMAASTVIFAMFPLLLLGMGSLKGFAITTIMGSLIGVLIARPAYAAMINRLLSP
jgi:preprotein translocase subunit SecD